MSLFNFEMGKLTNFHNSPFDNGSNQSSLWCETKTNIAMHVWKYVRIGTSQTIRISGKMDQMDAKSILHDIEKSPSNCYNANN